MTLEEAAAYVREHWDEADGCASCGFKSLAYEHEPIKVTEEDLTRGYMRFPCFSEDASENGRHRGIRVYFPERRGGECG